MHGIKRNRNIKSTVYFKKMNNLVHLLAAIIQTLLLTTYLREMYSKLERKYQSEHIEDIKKNAFRQSQYLNLV